jgi:hypothetical protein
MGGIRGDGEVPVPGSCDPGTSGYNTWRRGGFTSGKLMPSRHEVNDGQQETAERNRRGSRPVKGVLTDHLEEVSLVQGVYPVQGR